MAELKLIVATKEEIETMVREEHEKGVLEELKVLKPFIEESLQELKESMKNALDNMMDYKRADVMVELDLTNFSYATIAKVRESLKEGGWSLYVGKSTKHIRIKPF